MDGENRQQSPAPPGQWVFTPHGTNAQGGSEISNPNNVQQTDLGQPEPMLHPDDYSPASGVPATAVGPGSSVSWTASEFINHRKSFAWYAAFGLGAIGLAAAIFSVTKDRVSATVILLSALMLAIYASRTPRTLEYKFDVAGLTIAQKFYAYSQFRSFAAVNEGAFSGIILMPFKRFMPPITIYYDPKDAERIINVLSTHLPVELNRLDLIDQILRRIRF